MLGLHVAQLIPEIQHRHGGPGDAYVGTGYILWPCRNKRDKVAARVGDAMARPPQAREHNKNDL
ncbi:MAG: hypothetical protein RLZZ385_781 [Pseudomonadota bacterium]|jgi:hypothetical protein